MDAHPVSHPTDQTLSSYGLGQLDDAFARSVGAHLECCPDCRRRVAELPSGSSSGRTRDAGSRPDSSAPAGYSLSGRSLLGGGGAAPAPPRPGTLPPGLAESPDYEVITELGRGGMGVVYLARNTLMGRLEVLKIVSGHHVERHEVFERFRREIRSAARLRHPNIVTAYSALRLGDSLVLAMEYAEGLDLARMVKTRGPLPVANACYYVQQAALGLQYAHEHGMVHRDIKPANLILARERDRAVIKVLDFGLAKVSSEGEGDTSLTRVGQVLGTPDYIAPEQIRDAQSADIRADIYSLGCTFYYLLTGGPPFTGNNLWDLYQAHFSMDASPLNLVRPEVPAELAALVAKMMAKEPINRFQTPGAVAQALLPLITKGNSGPAGPAPEVSRTAPPDARPGRPAAVRAPARPAAEAAPAPPPIPRNPPPSPARPAAGMAPAPPPLPTNHPPPPSAASALDVRNDLRSPVAPRPERRDLGTWSTAIATLRRFGPWAWWAAAALMVLGLVAVGVAYLPSPPPARTMDKEIANQEMANSIGMKFALIPAGDFQMGLAERDRKSFPNAKAPHHVRIARPFYLGVHEVTRGQFRKFVNETGHRTDAENDGKGGRGCDEKTGKRRQDPNYTWRNPGFDQDDDHPVVNVSWNDAVAFARWLSRTEGKTYRLPTEAQWEYACRAGTSTRYSSGDDPEGLAEVANIADGTARDRYPDWSGIAAKDGHVFTAPVGRFRPNRFGLYDMHGNVWEWCADEFQGLPFDAPPAADPARSPDAPARVVRGGSWDDAPRHAMAEAFVPWPADYRSFHTGFRLALDPAGL